MSFFRQEFLELVKSPGICGENQTDGTLYLAHDAPISDIRLGLFRLIFTTSGLTGTEESR